MGPSRQNQQQAPAPDLEQQLPAQNQKALYQAVIKNRKQDQRLGGVLPRIRRDPLVIIPETRTVVQLPLHLLLIHVQHQISSNIQQAAARRNVVEEIMGPALI